MKISELSKYKWQIAGWAATAAVCCLIFSVCIRDMSYYRPAPKPCIFDRNGTMLIANRDQVRPRERKRIAVYNGKFAANVIGFTSIDDTDCETGMAGIEEMISRGRLDFNAVYLSLDCSLQTVFEEWLERIYQETDAGYVYAGIIRGNGEILTMAQRPVIDLNDRRTVPERGMVEFNTAYRLPVTDELMHLLGSSEAASPEEKERLGFTERAGVLPHEVAGRIARPVNGAAEADDEAGQAATALIYLRAYAAAMEKKDLPRLCLYADRKFSELSKPVSLEWQAVVRSKNEPTLTAAGIIRTDSGENFYCLVRFVHKNMENADLAERIFRSWRIDND